MSRLFGREDRDTGTRVATIVSACLRRPAGEADVRMDGAALAERFPLWTGSLRYDGTRDMFDAKASEVFGRDGFSSYAHSDGAFYTEYPLEDGVLAIRWETRPAEDREPSLTSLVEERHNTLIGRLLEPDPIFKGGAARRMTFRDVVEDADRVVENVEGTLRRLLRPDTERMGEEASSRGANPPATRRMFLEKSKAFRRKGGYIWVVYGESGSGKTHRALEILREHPDAVSLDGDLVRLFVTGHLGFSEEDRRENNRIVADIARLLYYQGRKVVISTVRGDLAYAMLDGIEGRELIKAGRGS